MDTFSKRRGYRGPEPEIVVREDAPEEFREILVDIAYEAGMRPHGVRSLVCSLLRRVEDPSNWSAFPNVDLEARGHIHSGEWYEVYDIAEAMAREVDNAELFETELNDYFRRRGIGWKLSNGQIEARGPAGFELAVSSACEALDGSDRKTAGSEIQEALHDLSRRPEPDLTGSIQHALAALECVARDVTGDSSSTLGSILRSNPDLLPRPLDAAAEKLWGFASEQGRHLREGRTPERAEAELAVHVAAAISAYLAVKTEIP